MNKKIVYQVGNNKKVILWCTANQTSRTEILVWNKLFTYCLWKNCSICFV